MKVAIITDQHFGARKNSKLFHDYFLKFYNNVFFPTLEERGIKTIIDMGDTFDNRRGIDFAALEWAKTNYYDRLDQMGCSIHTIVGNHTAYYKNTNKLNAVDLLLREYKKLTVYSEPTEVKIGDLNILFIPWINDENSEKSFKLIKTTSCKVAMGHLELSGFPPYRGFIMEEGMDGKLFKNFTHVFSGHYHTRSDNGMIYYLGNPYEIYFNDVDDVRGFHIFDTDTKEIESINNPYKIHEVIKYSDDNHQLLDATKYENKIVKLIVKSKKSQLKFEKYLDKLYSANVAELKIIENFAEECSVDLEYDFESEDTVSILRKYVEETEEHISKKKVNSIIQEIYKECSQII